MTISSAQKRATLPPIAVDILVEAGDWPPATDLDRLVCRAVEAVAATVRPRLPNTAELSILFTDDAHSRVLNRRYRKIDRATNVLSFPAALPTDAGIGGILGDIVLASETVGREAASQGLTIEAHLAHLVVHGFLHILGYDHADEAEATDMERLETGILGDLGFADPYAGSR